ncbi:unnamed protein product [Boreogadus saida]
MDTNNSMIRCTDNDTVIGRTGAGHSRGTGADRKRARDTPFFPRGTTCVLLLLPNYRKTKPLTLGIGDPVTECIVTNRTAL